MPFARLEGWYLILKVLVSIGFRVILGSSSLVCSTLNPSGLSVVFHTNLKSHKEAGGVPVQFGQRAVRAESHLSCGDYLEVREEGAQVHDHRSFDRY